MKRLLPLIAAIGLAACGGNDGDVLLGTLERDRLELVAETRDPIVEIAVREGEQVAAGQPLLRLDPAALDAALAESTGAVSDAKARLAEAVTGPRREEILAARARLAGAEGRLATARAETARVATLVERRLLAQSELDRQRAALDTATADVGVAREQLLQLERGTRSEVIEQAQAALARAEANRAQLSVSRERLDLVAPRAGLVEALPYRLGERAPAGAPLVVMLAAGQPYARVFVPAPQRLNVATGTAATVRVYGSDREWAGRVRFVAGEAAFTPYYALNERDRSRLSYLAEVELTDADAAGLPVGVPVEVVLGAGAAP
ncbi:MAG: HlyD family efflux transporter periplasmic adaptor subunit [Steroidobacteraceae bacterium]|jgi:HlyD family secretion protein|nr:HlyD family efflux transporter periplasmic adaptor subunit [Steroidobacteraceae bacterium]